MAQNLELELQKIGLDEREAKVYLAALELGPSPVQKIAQRASVPRATTYLVLDDLQNKGFITTYDKGKKTFFVAESPEQLNALVEEKELEIKKQKVALENLIPDLISRGQFEKGEKPAVRYYEGKTALKAYLLDATRKGKGEMIGFMHHDRAKETLEKLGMTFDQIRDRRARYQTKARVIYTSNTGPIEGYNRKDRPAKFVPPSEYSLPADITIRNNTIMLVPYSIPLRGVVIEDAAIAQTMKLVFELLWKKLS